MEPYQLRRRAVFDILHYNKSGSLERSVTGTITCRPYGIPIHVPLASWENILTINKNNQTLCISWDKDYADNQSDSLSLKIKDINDRELDVIKTSKNEAKIDFSKYDSSLYIVSLIDEELDIKSEDFAVQYGTLLEYRPCNCDLDKPIENLRMAYFMETHRGYSEATRYFKKAAQLSDKAFYKEMLKNHLERL